MGVLRGRLRHLGLADLATDAPETSSAHTWLIRNGVTGILVYHTDLAAGLLRHRRAVIDIRENAVVRVCLRGQVA